MNIFEKLLIAVIALIVIAMSYTLSVVVSPWIGIPAGAVLIIAILAGLTHEREYRD